MAPSPHEISLEVPALGGYGDWREDPAEPETTVSYLIRPA